MRKLTGFLLWLYVFTVPWDIIAIPGIGTTTRFAGMAAIGAAVLTTALEGRFRKPDAIFGLATAFTVLSALSLLWTVSYPATVDAVRQYAQLLGSVWVVREVARTREQQKWLLVAFCLGAFVPMGSLLNHYWTGVQLDTDTVRYTATGFNADGVALLLVIGMPMAWHLVLTSAGAVRAIALIYFALAPTAILLTSARGAFLAGVVALSIVPLTLPRPSFRSFIAVTGSLLLIVAILASIVPKSSWDRIATIPAELSGGSLTTRRDIWRAGLYFFPARPLLGSGSGSFGEVAQSSPEYHPRSDMIAHNLPIGMLVEQGIVGVALFATLVAASALIICGMPSSDRKLWAVIMTCWLVGMLSLSLERWKVTWLLFGLLAAYDRVGSIRRHKSEARPRIVASERPTLFRPVYSRTR